EEDGRGLGRRRKDDGDAVALLDPESTQGVGRLVREVLQLAPRELALRPVEALPDQRRLVARMLVANIVRDVVPLGHAPAVCGAELVIPARHRRAMVPRISTLCEVGTDAVSFLTTFFASGVEAVEALTIVLGVGVVRGWRSPLLAVGAALLV